MTYLLDTDILIDFFKFKEPANGLIQHKTRYVRLVRTDDYGTPLRLDTRPGRSITPTTLCSVYG